MNININPKFLLVILSFVLFIPLLTPLLGQEQPAVQLEFTGELVRNQFREISAILEVEALPQNNSCSHSVVLSWNPAEFELEGYKLNNNKSEPVEVVESEGLLVAYLPEGKSVNMAVELKPRGDIPKKREFEVKVLSSDNDSETNSQPDIIVNQQKLSLSRIVDRDTVAQLPRDFSLRQNQPNPFNPSTAIEYALPTDCVINLSVYDILGQKVRTLEAGEKVAGYYRTNWEGKDSEDRPAASGVYFIKLETDDFQEVVKVQLIK